MIISSPEDLRELHPKHVSKFKRSTVIVDTFALIVHFLSMYVSKHPEKRHILGSCNVEAWHIRCLDTIFQNFRVSELVVTPHILSEFINKLRRDAKADYEEIITEFMEALVSLDEISIQKTAFLRHKGFCEYGNDVSICLASDRYLNENKYLTIVSSDGRFVRKFFGKQRHILAFDIGTLSWHFAQ